LQREFAERDQKLKADESRLAETEARQKRDASVLSKADAERLAAEIDALRRGTTRAREQLRDDLARRSKDELDKRWPEIYGVVVEYAREKGYDLVVEAPVLYASPSVDITDAVLERLRRPVNAQGSPR
jgi:outer membrane protein